MSALRDVAARGCVEAMELRVQMAAKRREGLAWKRKRWSTATAGCKSDGVTSGNVAIARAASYKTMSERTLEASLQEVEERAQLIVVGGGLGLGLVGDDVGEVAHE